MGGTIDTYRYTREYRISNAHLFRECLQKAGVNLEMTDEELTDRIIENITDYHRWNRQSHIELPSRLIWSRYVFPDLNPAVFETLGEELSFLYETRFYIREVRPEIPGVLRSIQEMGLKIGVVSNTPSLRQVPYNLEEYGIRDFVSVVVLSSEYGRRKPDPAIFYYAARQANAPTGSCAFVGDKINRDILGARRAGFGLAVKIHHMYDDGEQDDGAAPDATISNMEELLPLLEEAIKEGARAATRLQGRKIKAIFFDAGDILYHRPVKDLNLNEFLHGKQLNPAPNFEQEKQRLKDLAFSGKFPRHEYYRQVIRLYGLDDPQEIEEGVAAISLDDNTVAIPEGVPETINALKSMGYILGIITDTAMPFTRKLDWFDQYGFGRVWDLVISSKELGARKPAPCMYEEALAQTCLRPDEAVFIGHKTSELMGAHLVGLNTIAVNYDPDAKADYYIEKITDLLQVPILKI